MEILLPVLYAVHAILILLILVKTVHYFARIQHRSLPEWFHFNQYAIYNSHNEKSMQAKKLQNSLTTAIAIFAVIDLLLFFLTRHA